MAAATLAGAPPAFFKKFWPLDKLVPLSVQIMSINASPIHKTFIAVNLNKHSCFYVKYSQFVFFEHAFQSIFVSYLF
jgi:hypothetical protein